MYQLLFHVSHRLSALPFFVLAEVVAVFIIGAFRVIVGAGAGASVVILVGTFKIIVGASASVFVLVGTFKVIVGASASALVSAFKVIVGAGAFVVIFVGAVVIPVRSGAIAFVGGCVVAASVSIIVGVTTPVAACARFVVACTISVAISGTRRGNRLLGISLLFGGKILRSASEDTPLFIYQPMSW